MKIFIKWVLTGNVSEFEEKDDLLGPQSTILELKGFISIKFGFKVKEIVLIYQHLLDNYKTLRDVGIVDQQSANVIVFSAHIVRTEAKLERSNLGDAAEADEEDETKDDDLQFFTHEDFILAMKMLGKDVPVSSDRLAQVRAAPPRSRPTVLANSAAAPAPVSLQPSHTEPPAVTPATYGTEAFATAPPAHAARQQPSHDTAYNPRNTRLHQIFARSEYGLRREGADNDFAIHYPGVTDSYQYWDMRLPENAQYQDDLCSINEVCFELFFFGEYKLLNSEKFLSLMRQLLEKRLGLKVRTPRSLREAGCMYPLVAVPIVVTELEGMELGQALLEDFGTAPASQFAQQHEQGAAVAGKPTKANGCGQQ